jgi:thiamine-phosphate pyrophosphorylase
MRDPPWGTARPSSVQLALPPEHAMAETARPQLTLITPPEIDLSIFPARLATVLDAVEVACLRLSLASRDEDHIARTADALREIAHARDIPLVIETHVQLVEKLGLDGVHLTDGARSVRSVRKALGSDAIIGSFCQASQHEGMTAGEAGADYVAFGPIGASSLGNGTQAQSDLFAWWSEVIEVPVIAEGDVTADLVAQLWPVTDFFGIGPEIWRSEDPAKALVDLLAPMR